MTSSAMAAIVADRALAVVRAPEIPDPVALANALAKSGIRVVELTFTTPRVLDHLLAATTSEAVLGVGTPCSPRIRLVRPTLFRRRRWFLVTGPRSLLAQHPSCNP